jgi:hypothetical protein
MANSIAVNKVARGDMQFQGAFLDMWAVTATLTQDTAVAINDTGVITLTVPGVNLGDQVISFGTNQDWNDGTDQAVLNCVVTAANTVSLMIHADVGEFAATAMNGAVIKMLIGRPSW